MGLFFAPLGSEIKGCRCLSHYLSRVSSAEIPYEDGIIFLCFSRGRVFEHAYFNKRRKIQIFLPGGFVGGDVFIQH